MPCYTGAPGEPCPFCNLLWERVLGPGSQGNTQLLWGSGYIIVFCLRDTLLLTTTEGVVVSSWVALDSETLCTLSWCEARPSLPAFQCFLPSLSSGCSLSGKTVPTASLCSVMQGCVPPWEGGKGLPTDCCGLFCHLASPPQVPGRNPYQLLSSPPSALSFERKAATEAGVQLHLN